MCRSRRSEYAAKSNKIRVLPLASDTLLLLTRHTPTGTARSRCVMALFVSLQGPARGLRMTPTGMRSLFRYHRRMRQKPPSPIPHRA